MNRVWIGALLLAALLVLSLAAWWAMAWVQVPIAQSVQRAGQLALAQDRIPADAELHRALTRWRNHRLLICTLADHQNAEDIECLFAQLPHIPDKQDYAAACADLARKVTAMWQAQALSWGGIL